MMKSSIDKARLNSGKPILTDVELNALQEEFSASRAPSDIHDLILADIAPEMLQALLQADSITIIAKKGAQELHLPLHINNDGYQDSLQGYGADITPFIHQHKLNKFQ